MKILIILLLASCASKEPDKKVVKPSEKSPEMTKVKNASNKVMPPGPSLTSKLLASEQGTPFFTEITFQKKSSNLTESTKKKISKLYFDSRKKKSFNKVQFVTWADKEYPSEDKKYYEGSQINLAKKRNENLKAYLQKLDEELKIVPISMAERASWLGRVTGSEKSKVEKSLQQKGSNMSSKSIILFVE